MESRKVVACTNCHLVQFETEEQLCRRCKQAYAPPPPTTPLIELPVPIATSPDRALAASVAKTILVRRRLTGMSQRRLAQKMRCPRTFISKLENQGSSPTLNTLDRLAFALGTTMSSLMADIESRRIIIQLQTAAAHQASAQSA